MENLKAEFYFYCSQKAGTINHELRCSKLVGSASFYYEIWKKNLANRKNAQKSGWWKLRGFYFFAYERPISPGTFPVKN
jgi:hypothetical protein